MEAQRAARTLLHAEGVSHRRVRHPEVADRESHNAIACGWVWRKLVRRGRTQLNSRTPLLCRSIRPDFRVFL